MENWQERDRLEITGEDTIPNLLKRGSEPIFMVGGVPWEHEVCCVMMCRKKNAERKTKLDSGCSLQAEKGRKNTAVVKQEKRDAWTNAAPRSDALNQTDAVERVM
jgi:hypothetical protein